MGELQGRALGGYQLTDEIGGGGVAEVYRARQTSGAGRDVVVKVIFKEFARQPGFARNLAYVTQASARLASHPHILPLVAHGEEGEYIYLVTPYVQAGTLADWINKGGRLGAADVGPFFQQLCGALSYAHSLGVVHGNLKPSNIYLHEGRHILLGDFGLLWDVRALDHSWSGSGVEAFEYLAPEVFGGQITQASDVYSLGATLFHSLTGHTPFHMNKLADLIAAAQQQQPPSLGQQQPPLAAALTALDPVVAQAMAKRPDERYPSAMQLAQSIEGALRQAAQAGPGAPVAAGQPQWQPFASTPVSAGVFGISGPHAPAFGSTPGQPVALGALSGAIPLTQLESPFPPLPPSAVDGTMEQGGVALGGGPGFSPAGSGPQAQQLSQALEPPTMHVATPIEGPTMRVAAPPSAALGGDMAGSRSGALLDATGQPITAPRARAVHPPSTDSMADSAADRYASSGLMPLDPPDALLDASIRRISQRLPAVQRDAVAEATAQSGQFSPTKLDLPRLTNPAMGNIPQDWQALLTDEDATHRHDPFAASSGNLPPITSAATPATSDADVFGQSGVGSAPGRHSANWSASDPAQRWEAPQPEAFGSSGAFGASATEAAVERPRQRSRKADYDIGELGERAASRKRPSEDEFNDTLQEQKVWTNSRSIVRIGKRVSAAPIVVMLLVLVILVELAGFAVTRPDLCVTSACATVAGEIQKVAPGLRVPGAPAPVTFTPSALAVSATTNGSGVTEVTLTNTGSRSITWSARTTLGWLTVSPATGSLAKGAHTTLKLTAQPNGVAPGSYSAGLVVDAATGQSAHPVTLTVTPGPVLAVTTSKLTFSACGASQPLTIANTGGAKLSYTASPSQESALSISPSKGTLTPGAKATLNVTLSCSATTGQPYAVILVSDGGSAQTPVSYGS